MIKNSFVLTLLLLAVNGILFSCKSGEIDGNGNVIIEDRATTKFSRIEVDGDFELKLAQEKTEAVRVQADDNILPVIQTSVSGPTLKISSDKGFKSSKRVIVFVNLVDIDNISISGSSDVNCANDLHLNELTIDASGSTDLDLRLFAKSLQLSISGAGNLIAKGRVEKALYDIRGAGDVHAYDLETLNTEIDIAGSGSAEVNASSNLDVKISGSGSVVYKGNPSISQKITGSGSIKKR